jgi:hypothetical protein
MNEIPAFNVRSYPAFRMARLHRVYVDRDALYLIRMGGVIGSSDAGGRHHFDPGRAVVSALLRWRARRSQDAGARKLDDRGPRALLDAHRQNLRVEPGEVASSRLEPPRLLGHGEHFAFWTLTPRGRKVLKFQVEDADSLRTALAHLPALLRSALSVTVGQDASSGRPLRVPEVRRP